ncbi:MAG: hypothetical protein WAN74_00120 [Thermoplasmata archaeon]
MSESGPILDVVNALADREGELEIRLEDFSIHLPMVPEGIRLDGTLFISLRMRELSEEEKRAHSDRAVRRTTA